MTNQIVAQPVIQMNELHIGQRVRTVTADTFNGYRGIIEKIAYGPQPAFYIHLDGYRADELLYFAGNELEAVK